MVINLFLFKASVGGLTGSLVVVLVVCFFLGFFFFFFPLLVLSSFLELLALAKD